MSTPVPVNEVDMQNRISSWRTMCTNMQADLSKQKSFYTKAKNNGCSDWSLFFDVYFTDYTMDTWAQQIKAMFDECVNLRAELKTNNYPQE